MVLPERKLLHLKDGLSFQGPVLPLALCKPGSVCCYTWTETDRVVCAGVTIVNFQFFLYPTKCLPYVKSSFLKVDSKIQKLETTNIKFTKVGVMFWKHCTLKKG